MFDFDDLEEVEGQDAAPPAPTTPEVVAPLLDEQLLKRIQDSAKACEERNDLQTWCMRYKPLGFPLAKGMCKLRVFCFHNAGSTESIYTGVSMSPFLNWVKETKAVEIVAMSYPGRDKLRAVKAHESIAALVEELLPVIYGLITEGVPFVFWGHSVGTWVAFETLMLMRKIGLPMPKAAFLNGFPGPQMPEAARPWNVNRCLNDAQMKQEVINWDRGHFEGRGAVVFEGEEWLKTWLPLMRSDFRLFDEYVFTHVGAAKFDFPIHSFHFEQEHFCKAELIRLWGEWTSATFNFQSLSGMGHLTCVYIPDSKKRYFEKVTEQLKLYYGLSADASRGTGGAGGYAA
jgi:medium-chain acyl-[acyl-carrier-protein] hydrolase